MIPDFKTYIKESVWGDLRKRSSGEVVRKEDDVNSFNSEDLFDYLKKNYEYKYPSVFTESPSSGGIIYVRLYSDPDSGYDTVLMYNNIDGDRELSISGGFKRNAKDIYNEMCKKYQLTNVKENDPDGEPFYKINIAPNDGKDITNKFFLEILDFIIERVEEPLEREVYKKHINESVWGDLRKRSSGEVTRREDDINQLDYEEFFVYLTKHYKPKSKKTDDGIGGRTLIVDTDIIEIFIPICPINGSIRTLIVEMDKKDNSIVSMRASSTLFDKYINLERMLSKNYTLNRILGSSGIYIKSKEKPTNRTVTDLIDIFLAVVDNPVLEKVS